MRCLNCKTEMVNYDVKTARAELSYEVCEKCGSLWLDAGELDKMAFQVAGSIELCSEEEDRAAERPERLCPRCDTLPLSNVHFLGDTDILLGHCRNCGGFWLDGGELNLIDQELTKIMPVSGHGFSDFVNQVHVPYWFKRIKRDSSETDVHYSVSPIPGAKDKETTEEKCPACDANLDRYSFHGTKFEGCPRCHGMWLTREELRKLKNKINDGQLHWLNEEVDHIEKTSVIPSQRVCPKNPSRKLVSVIFGHSAVVIDYCPDCHGLWLDRGEFDAIADYLREEATNATPRDVRQEIVKDLEAVVKGGPEGRLAELGDAASAVETLANTIIFDHPALFNLVTGAAAAGRGLEMG